MNTIVRTLAALVAGGLVFFGTLVGVTEALDPYIWPALVVSIPAALVLAVFAAGLTFGLLQYHAERARYGGPSDRTVTALVAFVVGTVAAVGGGVAAVLFADATLAMGLVSAMLVIGLPAGILVGIAAVAVTITYRDRRRPTGPTRPRSHR